MFAFIALIAVASAIDFKQWTAMHGKKFTAVEALRRRAIFNMNARLVAKYNKEGSFQLSLEGPFAAMTETEYNALLKPINYKKHEVTEEPVHGVPDSIDWRAKGKIPAVRDQAQCGSCYTFSVLAAVEGRLLIAGSKYNSNNVDLSEQQLVDCSTVVGNEGCNGGALDETFGYVKDYGVMREADYPYTAKEQKCAYAKSNIAVKTTGYKDVAFGSESGLKNAAAEGPVSVAIDASGIKFQLYKKGVYDNEKCSSVNLNHGVAVVGYGNESGKDYWIVRNSWGTSWGNGGYILMSRNKNNQCGIATNAVYPTGVQDA